MHRLSRQWIANFSCVLILAVTASLSADEKLPRVPDGFTIEKVAASPLVQYPMMANFDDRGRLFVAASAGVNLRAHDLMQNPPSFIRMLEDTDNDGTFDKSTIFADKLTLPQGAVWHRGALYVASPPNIWRFEDTDDDGVADKREILVNSFLFSGNAASIHGCFLGPNGRIYWCDGRHGHEFIDENGKIVSKGKAARIFSCKPDGSDVQVYCGGGMDNPVEVDFTETGEMFGTVNILLGRPRVDCLMHWVEGGVYPRYDQQNCIDEFQQTGDLLEPMTRMGHVAVSGMTRYRSDALGKGFQNNVFTTLFNTHKVIRSVPTRSGATFTTKEEEFLVSDDPDFHPTDVLEDADGSLLVIDTGGWFRLGCPTSKVAKPNVLGAIYRIRRKGAPKVEDPRGLKLGLEKMATGQLVKFLDDSRPAVREKTIDQLALRGEQAVPVLKRVVTQTKQQSETSRRNAVWALSRISRADAGTAIVSALSDKAESVRLVALRSLGVRKATEHIPALAALTTDASVAVRRQAGTALGQASELGLTSLDAFNRTQAISALFQSLRAGGIDRVLEHALIFALIRIADRDQTVAFLKDSNPQVRRAALIALDQMEGGKLTRELVTPLLDTDDPALQKTALEVISKHDGWAKEILTLLRQWLNDPKKADQSRMSVLRGVLLAQSKDAEIQKLVADALGNSSLADSMRLLLLEVMQRSTIDSLPTSWQASIGHALEHKNSSVRMQAVRIVQGRKLDAFDNQLRKAALRKNEPAELRVEELIAVAPRLELVDAALFDFVTGRLSENVEPLDRLSAARALAEFPLTDQQLLALAGKLDAAGPMAVPVLLRSFSRTQNEKVGQTLVAALDRSSSAANLSPDEVAGLLRNYPDSVQKSAQGLLKKLGIDPEKQEQRLAELTPLISGGDAVKGKAIFFGKKAACAGCHTVARQGGRVGPDLTTIGKIRVGRDLAEAIAFPSASFAREFRTYIVVTEEGKVHTGIISRQTADSVYLRTAALAEVRIPRKSIEELQESPTSIMPKGLDKTLSKKELQDLLAYLQGLK